MTSAFTPGPTGAADLPADLRSFLITHHHVVTAAEAVELGLNREVLRTLVRRGLLVRVARGAYVQASLLHEQKQVSDRHLLQARAVLRTMPQQWAASHQTAAVVWKLPLLNADLGRVHVAHAAPIGTARKHPTVTVHTHPGPGLVTAHDGIPTVEPNTAVVGAALLSSLPSGVMTADAALHQGLVTTESLRSALERHRRVPGVARARQVVELADGRSESAGESRLRLILRDLGLEAIPQYVVRDGVKVVARVDFYLPGLGVVLEFDGLVKYRGQLSGAGSGSDTVIAERARERQIRRLGYGVGRVIWGELANVQAVEREIREAAAQADLQMIARSSAA